MSDDDWGPRGQDRTVGASAASSPPSLVSPTKAEISPPPPPGNGASGGSPGGDLGSRLRVDAHSAPGSATTSSFVSYLESGAFSDVSVLDTRGRQWRLHGVILARNSPFFARLLLGPFAEARNRRFTLRVDDQADALPLVLRFLYGGEITLTEANAVPVLALASMYLVAPLVARCRAFLRRTIATHNAVDLLVAAYSPHHYSPAIVNKCVDVIAKNFQVLLGGGEDVGDTAAPALGDPGSPTTKLEKKGSSSKLRRRHRKGGDKTAPGEWELGGDLLSLPYELFELVVSHRHLALDDEGTLLRAIFAFSDHHALANEHRRALLMHVRFRWLPFEQLQTLANSLAPPPPDAHGLTKFPALGGVPHELVIEAMLRRLQLFEDPHAAGIDVVQYDADTEHSPGRRAEGDRDAEDGSDGNDGSQMDTDGKQDGAADVVDPERESEDPPGEEVGEVGAPTGVPGLDAAGPPFHWERRFFRSDNDLPLRLRRRVRCTTHEYVADFDQRGILYHIGTEDGTAPWQNPHLKRRVQVIASSIAVGEQHELLNRGDVALLNELWTRDVPASWFTIDFGFALSQGPSRDDKPRTYYAVSPTAYSLRHGGNYRADLLRSWDLQASQDGSTWTVLRRHRGEETLNGRFDTHTWSVPRVFVGEEGDVDDSGKLRARGSSAGPSGAEWQTGGETVVGEDWFDESLVGRGEPRAFRYLRILQTGRNSNNHNFLVLNGIEVFGDLYEYVVE
jgi:BTB/POZ domain